MSTLSDSDYADHIEQLLAGLGARHAQGHAIEATDCVCGLERGRDNKKVRDYVVKVLKLPAAEFTRALGIATTKDTLGEMPTTAGRLVALLADRLTISVAYNGRIRKREVPYLLGQDGRKLYIPADLWDSYEFKTMIATQFHCTIGFDDFMRHVRLTAAELGLPFTAALLNDASDEWYQAAIKDRLWRIVGELDYAESAAVRERGQASLHRLAASCFDCEHGPDFVVAIFNKFIWQVKRKIKQLPIFDHLMPVILGEQGIGKSTLVRQMLEPVAELMMSTTFAEVTDPRNISLWRNYVLFLDEMGGAKKAEMELVKNTITAETMTRRIFHTTKSTTIDQNATFIGTSNAGDLSELIRDTTGTRRFIGLDMTAQPDRAIINGMDWRAVWQSVDETADDPTKPFRAMLQADQEENRTKSPVEAWLDTVTAKTHGIGQWHTTPLYEQFREFEQRDFPGRVPTTCQAFARDMKRRCQLKGSKFVRREGEYTTFTWRG